MTIVWVIVFFIYGAVFGSFFNVVGLRVPKKQSISYPSSYCPTCNTPIKRRDLLPLISYIILRGRCRNCQTNIPIVYWLVEWVTGGLFAWAFWSIGWQWELIIALAVTSFLVMIVSSDLAYMLIPNKIVFPFIVFFFLARLVIPLDPIWASLAGALVGAGVLLLIAILSKGGMGGGDIKLFFALGLVVGPQVILGVLGLAAFLGLLFSLPYLKGAENKGKVAIPFGPAIACSFFILYYFGNDLWQAYLQLL